MNLPNKLTLARLVMTLGFMVAIFSDFPFHETLALLFFSVGGITDHLDGRIARKYNLITNFGKLMDPLADKIFTCTAFLAFLQIHLLGPDGQPVLGAHGQPLHLMPAWMVVVIVAREFAITGLRTLAASKNIILAAEGFGKHKTVSQIVCIIAVLVSLACHEWGPLGKLFSFQIVKGVPWAWQFALLMQWVTVALTLISGALYLSRNRQVFLTDV
jgi:CDP-diacylglycerol--glycerol-3-phosphate 3-phosphatidyltransferase